MITKESGQDIQIPEHQFEYLLSKMRPFFEQFDIQSIHFTSARIAFHTLEDYSPRKVAEEIERQRGV